LSRIWLFDIRLFHYSDIRLLNFYWIFNIFPSNIFLKIIIIYYLIFSLLQYLLNLQNSKFFKFCKSRKFCWFFNFFVEKKVKFKNCCFLKYCKKLLFFRILIYKNLQKSRQLTYFKFLNSYFTIFLKIKKIYIKILLQTACW